MYDDDEINNLVNNLAERAEALDKRLEAMIQGIQECREELTRIWGYELEPAKEREILTLRSAWSNGYRYFGLYRETMYSLEQVEGGFPTIDEALQWAKANGYVVYGYTQQPEQ